MSAIEHDGLLDLIDTWASLLGYYSGRIDLKSGTLSDCTTPDCTLTAHAPLWGTRKGKEVAVPVAEVRKRLSGMLRWVRIQRHSMHLPLHPEQHDPMHSASNDGVSTDGQTGTETETETGGTGGDENGSSPSRKRRRNNVDYKQLYEQMKTEEVGVAKGQQP